MYLRKLKMKDAKYMLSWMHDEDITKYLNADFSGKTLDDCKQFIQANQEIGKFCENAHYAIASDEDEYMGTVSLKNIDYKNGNAEFAIVVKKEAKGRGYSWFGIEELLKKAFEDFPLNAVYWCISKENERAIRFYEKHNFHETVDVSKEILDRYAGRTDLKWFSFLRGDILDERESVSGCKIIRIKTIPTIHAGELSFFEAAKDIPIDIKRIYYISKVPEGMRRGYHAHKELKQLLFCPYGRIQLVLEDQNGREEIELSDPSVAVYIDHTVWREMLWLQKDSVLCVAASNYYDENDYIRDYDEFKKYIGKMK